MASSFIHPVARDYFNKIEAAGGSVSDKEAINKFATQLSKLIDPSLWICLPLRSQHNIGVGDRVFSLGKLNDSPIATIVNGATWSSTGLSLTATNQGLHSAGDFPPPAPAFAYVAYQKTSTAANRLYLGLNTLSRRTLMVNLGVDNSISAYVDRSDQVQANLWNVSTGPNQLNRSVLISYDGNLASNFSVYSNGALQTITSTNDGSKNWGAAISQNPILYRVGATTGGDFNVSVLIYAVTAISAGNQLELNNIVKRTLGIGLSMP